MLEQLWPQITQRRMKQKKRSKLTLLRVYKKNSSRYYVLVMVVVMMLLIGIIINYGPRSSQSKLPREAPRDKKRRMALVLLRKSRIKMQRGSCVILIIATEQKKVLCQAGKLH